MWRRRYSPQVVEGYIRRCPYGDDADILWADARRRLQASRLPKWGAARQQDDHVIRLRPAPRRQGEYLQGGVQWGSYAVVVIGKPNVVQMALQFIIIDTPVRTTIVACAISF